MKKIGFIVEGMKCGGCKSKIENNFSDNKDISKVDINLEDKTVVLECSTETSSLEIKTAIESLGFVVPKSLRV